MSDQDGEILRCLNSALLRLDKPTHNHLDNVANIAVAKELVESARRRFQDRIRSHRPRFLDEALNSGDGVYRP